jgi:DNA (cytosine-5)-methyltransferase 1
MQKERIRTMHLFAGAGGGILSDLILGHEPVVAVEWEPYACQVLRERSADGWFPGMQVWEGDVRLFDASEYKGRVDCIHAGFPCQDISIAGKQAGVGEGTRSGLYREVLRIADEVQPGYIFLENVAAIVTGDNGAMLRTVIGDLAERGFDAVWCCLPASEVGAKHKRNRWWLLGYSNDTGNGTSEGGVNQNREKKDKGWEEQSQPKLSRSGKDEARQVANADSERHVHRESKEQPAERREYAQRDTSASGIYVPNTNVTHEQGNKCTKRSKQEPAKYERNVQWEAERRLGRMADDVAYQLDENAWNETEAQVGRVTNEKENRAARLKALGNGQVPLQAAVAFSMLWEIMETVNNGGDIQRD